MANSITFGFTMVDVPWVVDCTGLEEALSSMTQGEKAVFSCPTEYVRGSSLLPDPPHQPDRVELDLHLLRFSQVW